MAMALVSYAHLLGAMLLAAALAVEFVLLGRRPDLEGARRIARADLVFGAAAALVLLSGILRLLHLGKGPAFYGGNPLFHAKMALFVLLALLSVYPTVQILSWRPLLKAGESPPLDDGRRRRMRGLVAAELALVAVVPLLAALVAVGVGLAP